MHQTVLRLQVPSRLDPTIADVLPGPVSTYLLHLMHVP